LIGVDTDEPTLARVVCFGPHPKNSDSDLAYRVSLHAALAALSRCKKARGRLPQHEKSFNHGDRGIRILFHDLVPTIRDNAFLDVTGGKAHHLGHSLSEGLLAIKPEPTGSTTPTNTIGTPRHSTVAVVLAACLMTALVRYRIRLVAELNHRVRGFDAGRQERRQEHERAFGRLAVRHHRSDGQRPQRRDLIGARPSHRWIVDLVTRRCELQHHLESDPSMSNALANLVYEIVGRRLGALVLRQEMSAGVGNQL
jgi:hypothetical protein